MLRKVRMFILINNKRVETYSLGIYQHILLNTARFASVFPLLEDTGVHILYLSYTYIHTIQPWKSSVRSHQGMFMNSKSP